MYAIGIDIGTTTICGILLNLKTGRSNRRKLGQIAPPYRQSIRGSVCNLPFLSCKRQTLFWNLYGVRKPLAVGISIKCTALSISRNPGVLSAHLYLAR